MNIRVKDFDFEVWRDKEGNITALTVFRNNNHLFEWSQDSRMTLDETINLMLPFHKNDIIKALNTEANVTFSDTYKSRLKKIAVILRGVDSTEEKLTKVSKLVANF